MNLTIADCVMLNDIFTKHKLSFGLHHPVTSFLRVHYLRDQQQPAGHLLDDGVNTTFKWHTSTLTLTQTRQCV
jgi:hypothetical protein